MSFLTNLTIDQLMPNSTEQTSVMLKLNGAPTNASSIALQLAAS
jgi:hypothetical protein